MSENSPPGQMVSATPKPRKKPKHYFNKTPMGVVILAAALIFTHLVLVLLDPRIHASINRMYGTTPTFILEALSRHAFRYPLTVLIMSQFMHGGLLHLVMNLVMLFQVGPIAEAGLRRSGLAPLRLVVFFLLCGICAGLTYCAINPLSDGYAIGASGSISGVFMGFLWAAIGLAKPGQRMLQPVLSTAAVFLLINVGLAAVGRKLDAFPIAWESHLGGFLAGLILYPIIARLGARPNHQFR